MKVRFLLLGVQLAASFTPTASSATAMRWLSTSPSSLGRRSSALDVVNTFGGPGTVSGKTAVVTGGAGGIGLEASKALAYAGYKVIIASRNPEGYKDKCEKYVRTGKYSAPNAVLEHRLVDLERLETVRALADSLAHESSIDLLVCNAGIMALPKLEKTPDGFEKQIGVNHFGHHYLYRLLEPKLAKQTSGCRVVVVSSTAHGIGSLDPDDLHYRSREYSAWGAYGQSKLANLLFAKSVADRNQGMPITAVSLHPGVIRTALWRNTPASNPVGGFFLSLLAADKSIEQGAATTVYACLAPEVAGDDYAGTYLSDCAVAVPNAAGRDERGQLRAALWKATEEQLTSAGYALPDFSPRKASAAAKK